MTATIAVLGLGEAGGALARDLVAAGAVVRGYDPAVPATDGVLDTGSEAAAADGADLVLSVNSASAAVDALNAGLGTAAMWADLNTASPGTKRRLAEIAVGHGVPFADVAIMAPVPGHGLTRADATTVERLVSGSHRQAVRRTAEMAAAAETLDELGVPADVASAARDHLARL